MHKILVFSARLVQRRRLPHLRVQANTAEMNLNAGASHVLTDEQERYLAISLPVSACKVQARLKKPGFSDNLSLLRRQIAA